MTRDEIRALPAGKKLDVLVAEKVLGWVRGGKKDHRRPLHRESRDFPGKILNDWESKGPHDYLRSPDERYVYFCGCDSPDQVPGYSMYVERTIKELLGAMHDRGKVPSCYCCAFNTALLAVCYALLCTKEERR